MPSPITCCSATSRFRHALQSQFGISIPRLETVTLTDTVLGRDPKKLISFFYNHLLLPSAITHEYQLKTKWEKELGGLGDKEWAEVLESCKKVSPKLSDRLTHLYIIHRSYLTPSCLSRYRPDTSSACPVCSITVSTF